MLKESETKRVPADESCDLQVENAVRQRWLGSGHSGLRDLKVRIERDTVLLFGEVSTYFLKQTAQEVARVVCPHHQVKNLIVVCESGAGIVPET